MLLSKSLAVIHVPMLACSPSCLPVGERVSSRYPAQNETVKVLPLLTHTLLNLPTQEHTADPLMAVLHHSLMETVTDWALRA